MAGRNRKAPSSGPSDTTVINTKLLAQEIIAGLAGVLAEAGAISVQGAAGTVAGAGGAVGEAARTDTSTMSKTDIETTEKLTSQQADWHGRDRQWFDNLVGNIQSHDTSLRSAAIRAVDSAVEQQNRSNVNAVAQQGLFETLATLMKIFGLDKLQNVNETDYTSANILRDLGSTGTQTSANLTTLVTVLGNILAAMPAASAKK